jgi:hypothetical protein
VTAAATTKQPKALASANSASSNTDASSTSAFVDTLKICLYSKYGGRKTLQIGHLIDLVGQDNVLVVSAEHGLNTIRSKVREDQVISVSSLDEVRAAWSKAQAFAGPEKWVCIDGMSQITEWIANTQLSMADRYYEAKQLGRDPGQNDLPAGKYIQRGEINTMAIYGRVGRDSENLISAWIGLPVNLYCNYLEDMTGSSGFEKTIPWGPDVPGKVGLKAVMSSFDFVGRLFYNERGVLCAGFDPSSYTYMARTREDQTVVEVPKLVEDFNLAEFVKLVTSRKEAE